jgi:hypothetical protein
MGDTTKSTSTAAGRAVPIGIVCYEALAHIAYYEAYDDRPQGTGKYAQWPGEIDATASVARLRRAQIAWRAAIRQKRYRFL